MIDKETRKILNETYWINLQDVYINPYEFKKGKPDFEITKKTIRSETLATENYMNDDILNLKECPFCGSKDLRIPKAPKISSDFKDFKMYETCVHCVNCGASGPTIAYVDDVKIAWNERKNEKI